MNARTLNLTLSHDVVLTRICDAKKAREDILCRARDMQLKLNDENEIVMEDIDGREFKPTPHAMNQIANWAGKVPQTFINYMLDDIRTPNGKVVHKRDDVDARILLSVLRNGYRALSQDKKFIFRTYNDGTLRAMMTEGYSRVDNEWYVNVIRGILPDSRWANFRGGFDEIHGQVVIPGNSLEVADDIRYASIVVSNSEIGTGRISEVAGLWRLVCSNGMMGWVARGVAFRKVHRGIGCLKTLQKEIESNIRKQIPFTAAMLENMEAAREFAVGDVKLTNILAAIAQSKETQLSPAVLNKFAVKFNAEKCERNLFGIIDGLTRASQEFDPAEHGRIDLIAGKLVDEGESGWNRIITRAKSMTEAEHNKVWAIAA